MGTSRQTAIGWYGTLALLTLSTCLLVIAPWVNPPRIEVGLAVPTAFKIAPEAHPTTGSPPGMEDVPLILRALVQLRAVFRALRAGQPFVPANAIRIRRVAYAIANLSILKTNKARAIRFSTLLECKYDDTSEH